MTQRVVILISGGGSNMVALVQAAQKTEVIAPVLVISNNPNAAGLAKAESLGVETAVVDHRQFATRAEFEAALTSVINKASPDTICLAGFMRILTPEFVSTFEDQIINIHPSLLPKYPGLDTHQRALDAKDDVHGCTVHVVTADLDAGPVLGQASVPVMANDTAESLAQRVLKVEHELYARVVLDLAAARANPIILNKTFI